MSIRDRINNGESILVSELIAPCYYKAWNDVIASLRDDNGNIKFTGGCKTAYEALMVIVNEVMRTHKGA